MRNLSFSRDQYGTFLSLLLLFPTLSVNSQCIPVGNLEVTFKGPCDYNSLILAIDARLGYSDCLLDNEIACSHDGAVELEYHINTTTQTANAYITALCKEAQENVTKIPWSDVTKKGDRFDKEYFDGNGNWNEHHQSDEDAPFVSSIDNEPVHVLTTDAEAVTEFSTSSLYRYPIEWPDHLSSFDSCELQSVMCCFVSDRQAGDSNGDCSTPYDENCIDASPTDNTDVCGVDFARSPSSAHVSDGFAIFPDDEEGDVYCEGFAWSSDETDVTYRYRANTLVKISMIDNLMTKGYVRNVQGAPMCACVEQMPIVSEASCTEPDPTEFYKFKFLESEQTQVTIDYTEIEFQSCQANSNNDLKSYHERLRDEGDIESTKYSKFRETVVGSNRCQYAIPDLLFQKGYKYEVPVIDGWTYLYGRGSLISSDSYPDLWDSIEIGSYVRRICASCATDTHKDIIYKRITDREEIDFQDLFLAYWTSNPSGSGTNVLGTDFNLFSSFEEAQGDENPWTWCNYNYYGVGFPRDCGPTERQNNEWNSMGSSGETDFAFYLYTGADETS